MNKEDIMGNLALAKKDVIHSTRDSLRKQIIGNFEDSEFDIEKRDVHVTTRLSNQIITVLDALITLNVFRSRSEVVSSLVESSILSNTDLFKKLIRKADEVTDLRETAMDSILDTLEDDTT